MKLFVLFFFAIILLAAIEADEHRDLNAMDIRFKYAQSEPLTSEEQEIFNKVSLFSSYDSFAKGMNNHQSVS